MLPASTDHIVGHHAAHHDHRAHQRSGTDHFMVKDGYQDGVEDRLDAGDQAGRHRRSGLQADGEQDIGQCHLEHPQDQDADHRCGGEVGLHGHKGQSHHRAEYISPEDRADGVPLRHVVHHEHTGVGDPGDEGQHVPHHPASGKAVHKEEQDAAQHGRAGHQIQLSRPAPEEDGGEHHHENGGGELEDDGVGRRGHLVGDGEEDVGPTHRQSAQQDPAVHPGLVANGPQVQPDDHQGHRGPGSVDRHPVPRDHFDAEPPDAVQHRGGKDAQDASLLCGHDTAPFSVSLHISRPPELILRSLPRCSRPCGAGIHREDRAL